MSFSITSCFVPLKQGLSLNLGLGWQSASPVIFSPQSLHNACTEQHLAFHIGAVGETAHQGIFLYLTTRHAYRPIRSSLSLGSESLIMWPSYGKPTLVLKLFIVS